MVARAIMFLLRHKPPSLSIQDGFTHLTKDPQLLLGVANHFYTAIPGAFLVLVLDPSKLTSKVT